MSEMLQGILFGRFIKVSQDERVIEAKREGEASSKYYVVCLSDGTKTFEVTCGANNVVLSLPLFVWADFGFDVQDRKVKVVSAVLLSEDMTEARKTEVKKAAETKANAEAEAAASAAAEAKANADGTWSAQDAGKKPKK